ncbi:hypothetical protein LEP1GSC100_0947 [Leptospira interrogans serovar Bataviae str. UI 08561]|nr:hypothetical protein LEP1GSC100_0947 [Leptospira interrogans serovar Bataviae str. UI 08561]
MKQISFFRYFKIYVLFFILKHFIIDRIFIYLFLIPWSG